MKTTKMVLFAVTVFSVLFLVLANAGIDYNISQSGQSERINSLTDTNISGVSVAGNDLVAKSNSVSAPVFSLTTVITLIAVLLGMVAFRRNNY